MTNGDWVKWFWCRPNLSDLVWRFELATCPVANKSPNEPIGWSDLLGWRINVPTIINFRCQNLVIICLHNSYRLYLCCTVFTFEISRNSGLIVG